MKRVVAALVALLVGLPIAAPVWAGSPTDQLRDYTEQVIKILDNPSLKPHDREVAVRNIATKVFDVSETARRALGRHWQTLAPAEREEFVKLFGDLLERTYVSRIDLYGGERVRFVSEKLDGDDRAIVRGEVVTKKGTTVPVDAKMLRRGDRWMVYDIAVQNLSLIDNYRSQFDTIVSKFGGQELLKRLREKQGDWGSPHAGRTS